MAIAPRLIFGRVMHRRFFHRCNSFTYGIYYLALPLSKVESLPISYNRFGLISFYERDHGRCDGSDIKKWASSILSDYGIREADGDITLICMPRVLGYAFNPVSFWLCQDKDQNLRAALCEVHNTFGERHTYLCAHDDHRPITSDDTLKGNKVFHVSPMLEREGRYKFRFKVSDKKYGVWIDFYDGEGKKQLATSLVGTFESMNSANLRKVFWRYPFVTLKVITLIHWQALKLLVKGIKYIPKPAQKRGCVSATGNLTKM